MICLVLLALFILQGFALPPPEYSFSPAVSTIPITQVTSACTWTTYVDASFTHGPTSTAFTTSTLSIKFFDCHGCSQISTIPIGHDFIKVNYTTTVTATSPFTITTAVCSATPTLGGCYSESCGSVLSTTDTCTDGSTPTTRANHTPHPPPPSSWKVPSATKSLSNIPLPTEPGPVISTLLSDSRLDALSARHAKNHPVSPTKTQSGDSNESLMAGIMDNPAPPQLRQAKGHPTSTFTAAGDSNESLMGSIMDNQAPPKVKRVGILPVGL